MCCFCFLQLRDPSIWVAEERPHHPRNRTTWAGIVNRLQCAANSGLRGLDRPRRSQGASTPSQAGANCANHPGRAKPEETMKRLFVFTAAVFTLAACWPVASTAQQSCSEPPVQCDGDPQKRTVLRGCDAYCKSGETAMCLAADCFFQRDAVCTCQGSYLPPGK